jgi:2,4-didehydro-3-deoxy-L-rhamnonate hydrolase
VGQVGKIICIGLNYSDHAAETGATPPSEPIIFLKATSAICGPHDDLRLPRGATKVDWELELGVVIGTLGAYIAERNALGHVAGYCVANDVSERAYQLERLGTWDKGKGCDTFAPIGPWLVTADEVPVPQVLTMQLDVNGQAQQHGNTSRMIFGVAQVIAYVSQFMSLQSGDIILTGTPPGVAIGRKQPNYLRAGDRLTATIAGLGEQRQSVVESTICKILPNASELETF